MGLFGRKNRGNDRVQQLEEENKWLRKRNQDLIDRCNEKDSFFMEMISDGLRHGSPLAGKHMADRKKYKNGKY